MQSLEKTVNNVLNGVATILLYDRIGTTYDDNGTPTYGINGSSIAEQIQYLNEVAKVEKINIRINSIGGNVYEGYSIISSMLSSKAPCNTYIDGLAASISGVIAMAGKTCTMYDYGTLMLHNPFGKDAADDVLQYIKGTLVKIISNRSKRTQEEISFMMDGETWINATDAHKMGFVDEIVSSAKEFKLEDSNRKNLFNLVTIYNKLINETTINQNQMTEQEKIALEAQVTEANAKVAALEAEKAALAAKVAEFETEKTAKLEVEAVELIANAIKSGKIKEESKDAFIKMAKMDFETVKNSIESIVVATPKAPNILNAITPGNKPVQGRENWTIRDWEKKAPRELSNMKKENPSEYDRLFVEFYKK